MLVKDFEQRVSSYVERERKHTPAHKSSDSAESIADQHRESREAMRAERPQSKQGDFFTPEVGRYFRRQITLTLKGPQGRKIRESLRHAEPITGMHLQINQPYPAQVPLQSTPPSLLLNLPQLPRELQYRIVGRDLILYDVASDLVVDYLPGAVPAG